MRAARGFTMLELLAVVAIVAVGTAAAALSLGSVQADALEREGERLAALLEAGRARSRVAGGTVLKNTLASLLADAFFNTVPAKRPTLSVV